MRFHWGAQGRNEEALVIFRKGPELDPLSAIIRTNIGFHQAGLGRFDEARKTFERSIEMHPGQKFAYQGMATFHAGARGRTTAIKKRFACILRSFVTR